MRAAGVPVLSAAGPSSRPPGARRLHSFGIGVVLAAALAAGLLLARGPAGGPTPAAHFSLPRLGGGPPVEMPVVRGGRQVPVVLTFFASWCGPCHVDVPVIARFARSVEASANNVAFVGVDGNDDPASGLAFVRQSGVTFPVAKDAYSEVAPRFDLPGYPATVFIDAAGDVVHVVRGPVSVATLEAWTARLAGA
ncbi:MAG: TlpA family protein disulfide reductase [Acidimicrobiales bacterium]